MKVRKVSLGLQSRGQVGFTLLEALLALTLMIVLLSGVFAFYATILRARHEGCQATRDVKMTRAILTGMAEEIRHTTDIVPGDGIGFRGDRHGITIVRLALPEKYAFDEYDPMIDQLPPAQLDYRRVGYQLLWDDELEDDEGVRLCHGLWRTEQKTFDPNPRFVIDEEELAGEQESRMMVPRAEGELVAPEIKFLEFAYFDGANWRDRWQFVGAQQGEGAAGSLDEPADLGDLQAPSDGGPPAASGTDPGEGGYILPQAVRITIGNVRVDPEEDELTFSQYASIEERDEDEEYHADRFTIVVPILQADKSLLSSRKYGVSDSLSRQEGVR